MDRVTWLKTLWQYNFKSPAHLRRMSFIVHYQKFKEFWIWKYVAKFFLIFQAFFINLWSRGKHSWLWNQGSCVQIPAVPFLFLSENVGFTGNRTRGLWIQSQLCLPLDHTPVSDHSQSSSCYFQYFEYSKHLPLRYSDWARVGVVKVLLLRLLDTKTQYFLSPK